MKINDIILKEELDQKEADMVYQGLIASGEEYDKSKIKNMIQEIYKRAFEVV